MVLYAQNQGEISNNQIYGNNDIGVRIQGTSSPLIDLNIVTDNAAAGIGVFEQATPTIQNNQCYGNEVGILIDQGTNPILLGNDCHDNRTDDIADYR